MRQDAVLEYAEDGPNGRGWYMLFASRSPEGPYISEDFARLIAEQKGYRVTRGSRSLPRLQLARHASEEGPFEHRHRVRAWAAFLGYWLLTALDYLLRGVDGMIWRARWKLGVVMSDRPCPHCGCSVWRQDEHGCDCAIEPIEHWMSLPREAEYREYDHSVHYVARRRQDLFHWGRMHRFHAEGAIAQLICLDRKGPPPAARRRA